MTKQYKISDKINLEPEHAEFIKKKYEALDTALTAFVTASEMIKFIKEDVFKIIRGIYPELENYHFTINRQLEIIILSPKNDAQK